ncbi:FAD-binding oxidoreductase [Bacillus sp. NTK071]|uniref:NAD(P)/FAD-dependent oxidoreductase n=1 Tax=Bacillus sp. NTK071 TaxID=2802175 RepID=UPI001A8BFE12|nr:FAD-dependent oxidoreductase [Bacillus sp. NTK071]MBN8207210.1 FAD-binding oxidoreductase [Bacillus sp. NTK071]
MELHQGNLYWPSTVTDPPSFPALTSSINCDVLIIGGGMSGTIMARVLADYGINTVLIEKNQIGTGSTSANTGLLQFSNDAMLVDLIARFGKEKAVYFYKLCLKAIDELDKYNAYLSGPTDFRRAESLYYASNDHEHKKLKNEFDALIQYGFHADYLDNHAIRSLYAFEAPGGIYTKAEAEVNPYKFSLELAKDSDRLGVQIYENTEILSHQFTKDGLFFETEKGDIQAKKVIYATGYGTQEFAKTKGALLERTFTIATEPIDQFIGWHNRSLIWETARPYHYLRATPDNRILIGGLDDKLTKEHDLETKGQQLLHKLKTLFPHLTPSIAFEWSAVFGSTKDGLPFIGEHPKYKNVYFMLGYGGNGTVYSMLGAEILKDLILYGFHPAMDITRLGR